MKHTELPWHVSLGNNNHIWAQDSVIAKCNPEQAEMYREKSIDEEEANAAFIVKAVNNHEKLIEALKLVRAVLDNGEWNDAYKEKVMVEVRKAISNAEEAECQS